MIWFKKDIKISDFSHWNKNTMGEYLGLTFTEIGSDHLSGTLPVDHRTKQPYGLLHGGASAVLAETLGSVASALVIDHDQYLCVGIEINCNHLRSATNGIVTGICKPLHLGNTIHVWDIRIYDDIEKLTCVSRLTVSILKRR